MCGRFVSSSSPEQIGAYFGAEPPAVVLGESFNVAPTEDIYAVVVTADGARHIEVFHWGLVPTWAKDVKIGAKMINARAETLTEKGAFKPLLKNKRCIIPMDGFYEWQARPDTETPVASKAKAAKQPMYIYRLDGEPLAVAGLWAPWRDRSLGPEAPWLHSATVITTAANDTMASIHDRMPVILPASVWAAWLDPRNGDLEALAAMLEPAPNGLLDVRPVSTDVNKVSNKGAELIAPVDPHAVRQRTAPAPQESLFD